MPWYFKPEYRTKCTVYGCVRDATGWLYTGQNKRVAPYCTKHGEQKAEMANR